MGCHVIGERAVDIVQTAAIAIASGMRVDQLASIPLAYPTYAAILARAAASAAREFKLQLGWQTNPDAPFEANSPLDAEWAPWAGLRIYP